MRLCVFQHASQPELPADMCLYVLITSVYFSPSLASSRPPMAPSLFLRPERANAAQVTQGGMTCMHTSITVREAAGDELNMERHYSQHPECLHLYVKVEPSVISIVSITLPGRAINPRRLVEDAIVLIFLLNKCYSCLPLSVLSACQ